MWAKRASFTYRKSIFYCRSTNGRTCASMWRSGFRICYVIRCSIIWMGFLVWQAYTNQKNDKMEPHFEANWIDLRKSKRSYTPCASVIFKSIECFVALIDGIDEHRLCSTKVKEKESKCVKTTFNVSLSNVNLLCLWHQMKKDTLEK